MNSKLAKKIVSITVISLVVALIITTIVLAIVPKRMTNLVGAGYGSISVYQDGVDTPRRYMSDTDEYKKITELHEESLKDSLLSAILQGTGKFDVEVKSCNYPNVLTSIAEAEGTNAIVFNYSYSDEDQVLKIGDEVYKDSNTLNESTVTYNMIVMPLIDEENFELCTIYLADATTKVCSYKVEFLAHQAELFDYVTSLDLGFAA